MTPISRLQSKRVQTLALENADNKPKLGQYASQLGKSSSCLYQKANLFRSVLDVARLSLFRAALKQTRDKLMRCFYQISLVDIPRGVKWGYSEIYSRTRQPNNSSSNVSYIIFNLCHCHFFRFFNFFLVCGYQSETRSRFHLPGNAFHNGVPAVEKLRMSLLQNELIFVHFKSNNDIDKSHAARLCL